MSDEFFDVAMPDDPFTSEYLRHLRQDIGACVDEAMGWPPAYRKVLAAVFLAQGQRLLGDQQG